MSPMLIVGIVVVVISALVCYAFIYQTMENKRKQRHRLVGALKLRAKNFKSMLGGFPEGFLTKDLVVLVHRCIIDVTEQLAKLESHDAASLEDIQVYRNALATVQGSTVAQKRVHLDSPQQIKDVRAQLQELHKFIAKLQYKGTVSGGQAALYEKQIQKLMLQISVDAYMAHAKQAQAAGKARLAAHYYTLAKKLLTRDNNQQTYNKQIAQLDDIIAKLEEEIKSESSVVQTVRPIAETASKEWDKYENEEEGWKKKNVYD